MPILSFSGMKAMGFIPDKWPRALVAVLSLGQETPHREMVFPPQEDNGVREVMFKEFPEVLPDDTTVEPLKPMAGPPMTIKLVPQAKPFKRYKANSIPNHWQNTVKNKLDTMVKKDITE